MTHPKQLGIEPRYGVLSIDHGDMSGAIFLGHLDSSDGVKDYFDAYLLKSRRIVLRRASGFQAFANSNGLVLDTESGLISSTPATRSSFQKDLAALVDFHDANFGNLKAKVALMAEAEVFSKRNRGTCCGAGSCGKSNVLYCPDCDRCFACSPGDCCTCRGCDKCCTCDHECVACSKEKRKTSGDPLPAQTPAKQVATAPQKAGKNMGDANVTTFGRVKEAAKDETVKIAYRVAAKQFAKAVRGPIISMMKKEGADNHLIESVGKFLETEFGLGIIGFALGCGISAMPFLSDSDRATAFAEELRVGGASNFLNKGIDEVTVFLGPIIKEIVKTINAQPALSGDSKTLELPEVLRVGSDPMANGAGDGREDVEPVRRDTAHVDPRVEVKSTTAG